MWGAISRLFHKNGKSSSLEDESNCSVMDRQDHRRFKDRDIETYESRLAKQRATLKWMLLKAFNNRVPENLREPFYKDHQEQEHLKPQLVHYLASAELYCMALSNIYSDPNYNSLNHTGVIQALARKGVCLSDPLVTETTLIQTTPIKLSVHQVVMQGVMNLYSREVATPDLVSQAVHRFLPNVDPPPLPPDHEHALLLWINKAVEALKLRIQHEGKEDGSKLSELSPATELSELCDGAGLAALLSFYCPEVVNWGGIVATQLPTVSDCVRNLSLVRNFCKDYLPSDIFLMLPEEVYYMRASMKHNLVVFLADLFNMLEINPAKCVTLTKTSAQPNVYEGRNCQGVLHKRSLPQQVTGIPDLRSSLDTPSSFSGSPLITPSSLKKHQNHYNTEHPTDNNRNGGVGGGGDSDFVVHRGKGVTTLSSVIHGTHDLEPAGKPTNWGDNRKQSFAGRRSRRNSLSEDSQLTLENLCGSQENLHLLGRNPDKEPAVHLVRRDSNPDLSPAPPSPVHTTNGAPEAPPRRSLSRNNSFVESQRRAQETRSSVGIQQSLLEPTPPSSPLATPIPDDEEYPRRTRQWVQQNWKKKEEEELATLRKELAEEMRPDKEKKVTTFAALPSNTTTWQSISNNQVAETNPTPDNGVNESGETGVVGSQLINIRMKLEEKRRRIENEKKRMEAQLNRQRQKLGKEAFLQAISKGKAVKSPDSDPGKQSETQHKPARPFSLQDISEVEQKWLKGDVFIEERKTPDIENMDIESYQRSIAQMDSSLHEIQADLQRLSFDGSNPGNMSGGGLHQTPALQSFASLNQAPTYNNIKYINNIPQPPANHPVNHPANHPVNHQVNQGEFGNNGTMTHNMYNNQGRLDGSPYQQPYHRSYQQSPQSVNNDYVEPRYPTSNYQQNNAYPPDPRINNYQDPRYQDMRASYVDTRQQVNNWNQDLRLTSGNYQQDMRMNTGYQDQRQGVGVMPSQHVNSYQERPGSLPNNYPPEPPARRQWDPPQPPPSHYENYSPRYLEGQGSSYGSESGYGGSKTEDSSSTRTKGEFFLHEPSPSHRQRPTWNHPTPPTDTTSWIHQRREPVSLSSSPQSRGSGGLLENGDGGYRTSPPSLAPTPPPRTHAPVNPPPPDDMEPQSISFIGSGEEDTLPALGKVQITSGNRTYRVSSPTKNYVPIPGRQSSQTQETREQGFYISFDDDHSPGTQPRRPKPPLRTKRNSPKKERALTRTLDGSTVSPLVNIEGEEVDHHRVPIVHHQSLHMSSPDHMSPSQQPRVPVVHHPSSNAQPLPPSQPIIIGSQPDPVTLDEMERRKERIVLLSLQRRQAAEDARNRKEMEAARRREEDKFRKEERARKKEEDKRRRAAILEQHKVKKAIEEAEREGKQIDKELLACLKAGLGGVASGGPGGGGAKMRPRTQPTRPRPKTVHMDSDITDSPGLTPSRGKKGSSSNLSVVGRPMRRDYYRGSQDCLTETRRPSSLYNEVGGEESIGTSPGRSLARRASYKTPSRGGSSIGDGECDSGLGRGTRAPSPSGPGSLPLRSRMRNQGSAQFDDAASEAGSDYSGPRLYRQPATKSNKGIIVNAIEYCVFPGVVNMEMKRKTLEAVNRSEAKHFLVLFRDAGCQFRALYTYQPDTEEIIKLHGIGPKQVTDRMFDKFFKYNSGGKCFSQVHTKHLTVTIDAFTIHNSLWQGKKVNLPNKADMTLVI